MDDKDRMLAGCMQGITFLIMIVVALLLCLLFSGCTTTKYVPVAEQHTEHHWHTDSVKERDSVHTENTTIIREVDSAAMAKYGIQMQNNQRAWLVLQREMEQRLRELEHMTATHDTIRDSIPAPYPVEVIKEVPAELTWWQQTRLHLANIVLWLLALLAVIYVGKKHLGSLRQD
jgi:outer membrane biogenesis lipoprotein LolB